MSDPYLKKPDDQTDEKPAQDVVPEETSPAVEAPRNSPADQLAEAPQGERDALGRLLPGNRFAWRPGGPSPNPKGRPKNVSLESLIREEMEAKLPGDHQPDRTLGKIIAQQLVRMAAHGNLRAIAHLMDLDGLRRHRLEIEHVDAESMTDLQIEIVSSDGSTVEMIGLDGGRPVEPPDEDQ